MAQSIDVTGYGSGDFIARSRPNGRERGLDVRAAVDSDLEAPISGETDDGPAKARGARGAG